MCTVSTVATPATPRASTGAIGDRKARATMRNTAATVTTSSHEHRRQDDAALLDPGRHRPGHPDHRVLRVEVRRPPTVRPRPPGRRRLTSGAVNSSVMTVVPSSREPGTRPSVLITGTAASTGLTSAYVPSLIACARSTALACRSGSRALRVALHDRHPAQQREPEPVERAQFALHRGIVRRHQLLRSLPPLRWAAGTPGPNRPRPPRRRPPTSGRTRSRGRTTAAAHSAASDFGVRRPHSSTPRVRPQWCIAALLGAARWWGHALVRMLHTRGPAAETVGQFAARRARVYRGKRRIARPAIPT